MNPYQVISYNLLNETLKSIKPEVIYDIGANEGGFVDWWLQTGARVHCFEPVPDVFEKLASKHGSNAECRAVGVSDEVKELENQTVHRAWVLLPKGSGEQENEAYKDKPPFMVRLITLDYYTERMGQPLPSFVKLDVDGYEPKVLRGGKLALRNRPPIMFEMSFLPRLLGESCEEMVRDIFRMGYNIGSMDGNHMATRPEEFLPFFPWETSFDVMLIPA